jgi:hypothetical protein
MIDEVLCGYNIVNNRLGQQCKIERKERKEKHRVKHGQKDGQKDA